MSALHVFDMDGTLLQGTTASLEIGRRLNCTAELTELEARFAAGELSALGFAETIRELWSALDEALVDEVAAAAPWLEGIDEVCSDIRRRGETSMLITMSPDFFARRLSARGIDIVRASVFPPLPFTPRGGSIEPLLPRHKVDHVEQERQRLGLSRAACVAYGDSMSDGPLFAALTNTVAVNADHHLESAARTIYRGSDLREAYAFGRALLARDDPGPDANF